MTRFLCTFLMVGVCSAFGLMGCADESKVKETSTVETPGGTTTTTSETKVEQSGNNPPPATTGETAAPAK